MATMSSDSDGYEQSDSSIIPNVARNRSRHSRSVSSATDDVQTLTSSLRKTNTNLKAVDGLLGYYKDNNERQNAAIERLRDTLARSTESLRQERAIRMSNHGEVNSGRASRPLRASDLQESRGQRRYQPTSPLNDYTGFKHSRASRHLRKPSVRFREDLDEIHDVHVTVRDLSDNQIRLEDDLDQEIQQRNQAQIGNQRALQELNENLKKSQIKDQQQQSSQRVDKRLQAIQEELRQHRMQQEMKEQKDKETQRLSAELKHAIAAQSKQDERGTRERLLKVEAEKQQLAMQLERAQRKLDRSQGVTASMKTQLEEYKSRLRSSDHDRSIMQNRLADLQEAVEQEELPSRRNEQKLQKLQETQEREHEDKQRLEEEIKSLRLQLSQSQDIRDLDKSRRDLQQSEKQREHLSRHLEALTKELEDKERHISKLATQLQETNEDLQSTKEQEMMMTMRLKELEKRLGEGDRKTDRQAERLTDLQIKLDEANRKKEDIRTKARDKIRQWKLKCAKYQHDSDSLKHRLTQTMDRNHHLLTDTESHRIQNGASTQRMDSLQRELNDILEKRAQQDEQLRLQDIQINELKSVRKDLELELRDTRSFMDKLDNELRAHQVRYNVLADEKLGLDEDLKIFRNKAEQAEDHIQKLQAKWHSTNLEHSELSSQLAEESGGRRVAEAHVRQLTQDLKTAKEDMERLTEQIKQEKRARDLFVEELQKENEEKKSQDERMLVDRSNRLKRERAEMDAELQTLKLEIADSNSQLKTLRRQLEESRQDTERSQNDMAKVAVVNEKLGRRYERAKASYQEQVQLVQRENTRACDLEQRLKVISTQLLERDLQSETILRAINGEVDCLVEVCSGQDEVNRALLSPTRDIAHKPQHWLAEIKSKLQWIQNEISNRFNIHKRLKHDLERSRTDIDEVVRYGDLQNKVFQSKLVEQDGLVHDLKQRNHNLLVNKKQKDEVVKSLEKQVVQLEHHIESNVRSLRKSLELAPQPDTTSHESSPAQEYQKLKDLQEERDRINDRYNRYKGTFALLQQQLQEAKESARLLSPQHSPPAHRQNAHQKSPSRATVDHWTPKSYTTESQKPIKRFTNITTDENLTPFSKKNNTSCQIVSS